MINTTENEVELSWLHSGRVVDLIIAPCERDCMTPGLIGDLNSVTTKIIDNSEAEIVLVRSKSNKVFSYGGDLSYFSSLIESQNRVKLMEYGTTCINLIHWALTGGKRKLLTAAIVYGHALGGGFEAAMACKTIIAEKQAKFALPEVMFGLFPGMGAYPLLTSLAGEQFARQACLSGKQYTASELKTVGIVQSVVSAASMAKTIDDFVQTWLNSRRCAAAIAEMAAARPCVSYQQLQQNVELWVDAAMALEDREILKMQLIAKRQAAKSKCKLAKQKNFDNAESTQSKAS